MSRLRRTLGFAVPLTCAALFLIGGAMPAAAATRSPLLAQRNASPSIAIPTPPVGSVPITLMNDAQLRARLNTDSVFAAQIRDHDAHYASGKNAANMKLILQALHLTAPSQLNADYVYIYSKDTKRVSAVLRSQLGSIRGHAVPMSFLNAIGDIYWLSPYTIKSGEIVLNAFVWATCSLEWLGPIPIGGCGTGQEGTWYGPRYGQESFYAGASLGWTSATNYQTAGVINVGFGYYHFVAENFWADTHIMLEQEVYGGKQLFG